MAKAKPDPVHRAPLWLTGPVYGLLAIAPGLMLRPALEPFHLPKATLIYLVAGISVVGLVFHATSRGRAVRLPRSVATYAAAAFFFAAVLSTAFSMDRSLSLWGEYNYFTGLVLIASCLVLALVVLQDISTLGLRRLSLALAAGSLPVIAYGLLQWSGHDPFEWQRRLTAFSTMGNPNQLAGYLGAILPILVALVFLPSVHRWLRVLTAAGVMGGFALTLGTDSFLGPITGVVAVGVPAILVLRRSMSARAINAAAVIAVTFALAGIAASWGTLLARFGSGLEGRIPIWKAAINIAQTNPALGSGLGTFGLMFPSHRPPDHAERFRFVNAEQAHNTVLNLLAEGGLVLAVSWLVLTVAVGWALVRGLRTTSGERQLLMAGIGGSWVGYHAQSLVANEVPAIALLHWITAAAIMGMATGPDSWLKLMGTSRTSTYFRGAAAVAVVSATWVGVKPLIVDVNAAVAVRTAQKGDAERAEQGLMRVVERVPYRATYPLLLASLRQSRGDEEGAYKALTVAAARDVGSSRQALAGAEMARSLGREREALRWYKEAKRRDPHNPAVEEAIEDYLG